MGLTNYSLKSTKEPEPVKEEDSGSSKPELGHCSSLDCLVESIYNSVIFAQRKVETEHLKRVMSTYFDDDGNALTFKVNLPSNNGEIESTDIPLITLAPNSHLSISELEMELKVDIGQFDDEKNNEERKLSAKVSGTRNKKNLAKIKIKMNGSDPPEGLARINDQLIKILPS